MDDRGKEKDNGPTGCGPSKSYRFRNVEPLNIRGELAPRDEDVFSRNRGQTILLEDLGYSDDEMDTYDEEEYDYCSGDELTQEEILDSCMPLPKNTTHDFEVCCLRFDDCGHELENKCHVFVFHLANTGIVLNIKTSIFAVRMTRLWYFLDDIGIKNYKIRDNKNILINESYGQVVYCTNGPFKVEDGYGKIMSINWNQLMHALNGNMDEMDLEKLEEFYNDEKWNMPDEEQETHPRIRCAMEENILDDKNHQIRQVQKMQKRTFRKDGKFYKDGQIIGTDKFSQKQKTFKNFQNHKNNRPEEIEKFRNQRAQIKKFAPKVEEEGKCLQEEVQNDNNLPDGELKGVEQEPEKVKSKRFSGAFILKDEYAYAYTMKGMTARMRSGFLKVFQMMHDIGTWNYSELFKDYIAKSSIIVTTCQQFGIRRAVGDLLQFVSPKSLIYEYNLLISPYIPIRVYYILERIAKLYTPRIAYLILLTLLVKFLFQIICVWLHNNVIKEEFKVHRLVITNQNIPTPEIESHDDMRRQADQTHEVTVKEELCMYNEYVEEYVNLKFDTPLGKMETGGVLGYTEANLDLVASRALVKEMYQPRSVSMNISPESLMERMASNTANGQFIDYDRSTSLNTDIINDSARLALAIMMSHRSQRVKTDIYEEVFRRGDLVRVLQVPENLHPSINLLRNLWRLSKHVTACMGIVLTKLIFDPVQYLMSLSTQSQMLIGIMILLSVQLWRRRSFHM